MLRSLIATPDSVGAVHRLHWVTAGARSRRAGDKRAVSHAGPDHVLVAKPARVCNYWGEGPSSGTSLGRCSMRAINPGETTPESGRYEQVEHSGAWTGVRQHFDRGERMPSLRAGRRWVWIDQWVADRWPDAKAENEALRRCYRPLLRGLGGGRRDTVASWTH